MGDIWENGHLEGLSNNMIVVTFVYFGIIHDIDVVFWV